MGVRGLEMKFVEIVRNLDFELFVEFRLSGVVGDGRWRLGLGSPIGGEMN